MMRCIFNHQGCTVADGLAQNPPRDLSKALNSDAITRAAYAFGKCPAFCDLCRAIF